ncbi:hypothetical protein DL546_001900 [Coniochaeta pulveracea]|uniref:NmrA-like domain-containing protein n=1 Tax=Coniochaeta pulveracea TaxID=177199 RepID=A0A420Y9L0_9PEZI|nr:hypothetical protein DL546_001900 [Coniochaeta pulveracea]
MDTPQSILLLGAGELGTAILQQLANHPSLRHTHITIALRPTSITSPPSPRQSHLRTLIHPPDRLFLAPLDLSLHTAKADLTSLIQTIPADIVISATGFAGTGQASSSAQITILEAVLAAGCVKRYFPWQFGVDYDIIGSQVAGGLMSEQCRVRELLRERCEQAGVEWCILSTGMFMSFIFEEWFGVVEGMGEALKGGGWEKVGEEVVVRALGSWDTQVTLTDADDIGRVLADLVAKPPKKNDKGGSVLFMAGETITYRQLADTVERVLGKKVTREEWSLHHLKKELDENADDQINKYRVLFGRGDGVSWLLEQTINVERGLETKGVEGWLSSKLNG